MIDVERIKAARKKAGLTQTEVGDLARERVGKGTQQGYAKLEKGVVQNSRFLSYYCDVLGLDVSEVDLSIRRSAHRSATIEEMRLLPRKERLTIIQELLSSLLDEEV